MAQALSYVHIPGVFWIAVISFILMWLPQLATGAPWLDEAMLIVLAVLKGVEVLVNPQQPMPTLREVDADAPPAQRGRLARFLLG